MSELARQELEGKGKVSTVKVMPGREDVGAVGGHDKMVRAFLSTPRERELLVDLT